VRDETWLVRDETWLVRDEVLRLRSERHMKGGDTSWLTGGE
jgi:hypothetical protein